MFVAIDDFQERLQILHCRGWLIALPFQVLAHPEDLPVFPALHVGGFGNRRFPFDAAVLPIRPDLEEFNILAPYSVREVELVSQMGRWPTVLQVAGHDFFAMLEFDFAERHVC